MNQKRSLAIALSLTVILHALRILLPTAVPGLAGFSTVGAAAIFAGATFPGLGAALLTTLLGLLAGDLIVQSMVYQGRHGFPTYAGWEWVYGSLALMTVAGVLLKGKRFGMLKAGGLAVAATASHWWITNTGVWFAGGCGFLQEHQYTPDLAGYLRCLTMAIPYNLRFLAGTLVFGALAFGAYRLLTAAPAPAAAPDKVRG